MIGTRLMMEMATGKFSVSSLDFECRGVFGKQFDPLVFGRFSKFATKRAKMTVKE